MSFEETKKRVDQTDLSAKQERLKSPEMIQKSKAARRGGASIRKAYCKNDAGTQTATSGLRSIDCYLDTDGAGDAVEVECSVIPLGTYLNAAVPRLADGDLIFVNQMGGIWYCTTVFQGTEDCDCYNA